MLKDKYIYTANVTAEDHVAINRIRIIMDGDVEVGRGSERMMIAPNDNPKNLNGRLRRIIASVHVPTVVALHNAKSLRADRKIDRDQKKAKHDGDPTPENEAEEQAAEAALLAAEAELEAAEAAHEAFLAAEDE